MNDEDPGLRQSRIFNVSVAESIESLNDSLRMSFATKR